MKRETVQRIIQTADDQFRLVGFKDWDSGLAFSIELLTKFTDLLRNMDIRKILSEAPELSPDEVEELVKGIKQMFGLLRKQTKEFTKKEIPHPPGGRPTVLGTPQRQALRIQQVLSLIGKKVKTKAALERVAQREHISLSSMQRIWRTRGTT